jgi:hypothetical protein
MDEPGFGAGRSRGTDANPGRALRVGRPDADILAFYIWR